MTDEHAADTATPTVTLELHMDRLASMGETFEHAMQFAAVPAFAHVLHDGRYVHRIGAYDNGSPCPLTR